MSRLNIVLTVLIAIVFISLMFFAGQPMTAEADLVQKWYDTLCNPKANQAPLYELTWRGDESSAQLETIINGYRATYGFSDGCTAIENHNIIYFQAIPPELAATVERIKFVAVNVYKPTDTIDPNHVSSVQYGVHVLFYKSGAIKILPHFIPDSPLGMHQSPTPITLYNNDGLLMGQVAQTGAIIRVPENDLIHYGIPISLSTVRVWMRCWVRVYVNGLEVDAERYGDILPTEYQADFLPEFIDSFSANETRSGEVWFSLSKDIQVGDVRISVDAYQTYWDLRALPVTIKVQ